MKIGQRVMLIANHALTDLTPPPIGSIGEIAGELDEDGDYMVDFPDFPCTVGEPEWFVFASYLIPIDRPPSVDMWFEESASITQEVWNRLPVRVRDEVNASE